MRTRKPLNQMVPLNPPVTTLWATLVPLDPSVKTPQATLVPLTPFVTTPQATNLFNFNMSVTDLLNLPLLVQWSQPFVTFGLV